MTLFSITLILFLIMDPIGNVSGYLSMVNKISEERQHWIVIREMLIALFVMIFFNYIGKYIFSFLNISEITVMLSSGVILFLTGIRILFPADESSKASLPAEEPFIVPLAIPLIAGPSLLATIMLFAHQTNQPIMLGAILIAWFGAVVILYFSNFLERCLGRNGLIACERLIGMILLMLAIQRLTEGVNLFCHDCL